MAIYSAVLNGVFLLGLVGAYGMRLHAKAHWEDDIASAEQSAMNSYLRFDGWVGGAQAPWGEIVIANIPDDSQFYEELRKEGLPEVKLFFVRADHNHGTRNVTLDLSTSVFELDQRRDIHPTEPGVSNTEVLELIAPEKRHRWQAMMQGKYQLPPGKPLTGAFLFADASLTVDHVTGIRIKVDDQPVVVKGAIMPAQVKERLADQRIATLEAAADAGTTQPDAGLTPTTDAGLPKSKLPDTKQDVGSAAHRKKH
jgi:hypothetical protein